MCVGRCRRDVHCSYSGGVPRGSSSSFPSPDESPPSALRGCGREKLAPEGVDLRRAPRLCDRLYKGRLCLFATGFREERAKRKTGKGLHEVCLLSAEGVTRGACGR